MAWTLQTALFFGTIFALLVGMAVWEYASPGGNPRVGILRFETTRGDRLFISLLGSAFIHLAWLGLIGRRPLVGSRSLGGLRRRRIPLRIDGGILGATGCRPEAPIALKTFWEETMRSRY
jgi:predicted small integral membrane protein